MWRQTSLIKTCSLRGADTGTAEDYTLVVAHGAQIAKAIRAGHLIETDFGSVEPAPELQTPEVAEPLAVGSMA